MIAEVIVFCVSMGFRDRTHRLLLALWEVQVFTEVVFILVLGNKIACSPDQRALVPCVLLFAEKKKTHLHLVYIVLIFSPDHLYFV